MTMKIETDDYKVYFDAATSHVVLSGFLRLNGLDAYQPIMDLLLQAVTQSEACTIDMRELEFLNSSGISMLSMVVVQLRELNQAQLVLIGSQEVLWQVRSLKNLKRLLPNLQIEFV